MTERDVLKVLAEHPAERYWLRTLFFAGLAGLLFGFAVGVLFTLLEVIR